MPKKFTKKMILAYQRTIRAYERLVWTGDVSKWRHYGLPDSCRFCKVRIPRFRCSDCPVRVCTSGETMDNLVGAILTGTHTEIKKAVKARLAWIKRKGHSSGIVKQIKEMEARDDA